MQVGGLNKAALHLYDAVIFIDHVLVLLYTPEVQYSTSHGLKDNVLTDFLV
jgi:hypothetical protein